MGLKTALRVTAVCSFVYVALFIALQVYLPQLLHGDQAPVGTSNKDADAATLLRFVNAHADYFSTGYLLTALSFVLLLPTVFGLFLVIRPYRMRVAQALFGLGIVTVAGLLMSQIIASNQWQTWAHTYSLAPNAAAKITAVHGFENGVGGYQIAYLVADTGLALWFALIGVTFLRMQGTRSLVGWGTIATGLLYITQLPVLPVWTLAAGIGLWRLSAPQAELRLNAATAVREQVLEAPTRSAGNDLPARRPANAPLRKAGKRRRR